ncbi:hypothetical protein, partial [Litorivivens sp.]
MSTKRVATVIIFTLLLQQVGTVWAATLHGFQHLYSTTAEPVVVPEKTGHCVTEQGDSAHALLMQAEASADPVSEECCTLDCECCVGHCQSGLT